MRVLAALLGLLLAAAAPAAAQGQGGALPPRPDPRSVARPAEMPIKVRSLKIIGADTLGASRLASVLGTRASSRLPWGRQRYFDRKVFDADLRRIEAYYRDRGYPDAQVASFDVKLNERQDSVALSITVREGEPLRVERIDLLGFESLRPGAMRALRRNLPLEPGAVADRAQITAMQTMAARALQDRGFPFAQASIEEARDDHSVRLTVQAMTGDEARYGPVTVAGNVSVGDDVIRRTLAFEPGDRYSLASVQLSQRRLYELGLFQVATVATSSETVADGQVPMQVTVAEAKHRQIRLSAGYGSEEHARGEAQWKHVNFLGGARTGSIEGKWSSLTRGVRTSFTQPYLFSPKLQLTVSTQGWLTDEPAFRLDTRGGRGSLTYELTQRNAASGRGSDSTLSFGLIAERESYAITTEALNDLTFRNQLIALGLDPRTGEGGGLLGALTFDYRRSTTPSVLDSRRGSIFNAHLERAGARPWGDFNYTEITLEARHYRTIGRFGVLAFRGRIGTIDGQGPDELDVPFFKRYFLGGSNSLRGWGRFEVSPLSGSGLPIGGHSMVEMSSELRTPLLGKASLVLFADAGSVASSAWNFADELRYDAGPGLRYLTPVGPIRVDLAFQLNRIPNLLVDGQPESRRWRVHFSLGQAF
jgi:outer membrane protein insertion porin family/translocation and assembly module TamA